jgi:hypothetical protein
MAKKDKRYAYEIVSDVWGTLKTKYPKLKVPLKLIDEMAGFKVGTCSPIWYGKTKKSEYIDALLKLEKKVKKMKVSE